MHNEGLKRQLAGAVLATWGLLIAGQTALAAPDETEVAVKIAIPAGASADELHARITRKARRACDSHAIYAHLQLAEAAACRRDFVRDAVLAIDRPALTALYRERARDNGTRVAASAVETQGQD